MSTPDIATAFAVTPSDSSYKELPERPPLSRPLSEISANELRRRSNRSSVHSVPKKDKGSRPGSEIREKEDMQQTGRYGSWEKSQFGRGTASDDHRQLVRVRKVSTVTEYCERNGVSRPSGKYVHPGSGDSSVFQYEYKTGARITEAAIVWADSVWCIVETEQN